MILPLLLALGMQVPDTAHVVIVSTTDIHGHATAWDYVADKPFSGGLVRAAAVVDSLRQRYPGQVVLVDAGDVIQGDPFAAYFSGEAPEDPHPVIDAMGAMAYDAATPGNHEFNWGLPFMFRALKGASFPYVSGNVYTLPEDTLAFPAYTIVQRGGVRIGITGFTTPGVMVWDRENVRGHARIARIGNAADRILRLLRPNADLALVLVHSGMNEASSYDTAGVGPENASAALASGAVRPDLVIVGHTHREMADSVINGVHFVQPGHFAQSLSVVHVTMQRNGTGWRPIRMRGEIIALGAVEPFPALVRRLETRHDAVRRWVSQPLGNVLVDMPATTARAEPTAIINFINEVERRKAGTDLASTPAFDIRRGLSAGETTIAEMFALYPYENTLRGIRITGQQLKSYLEQSARYYAVDAQGRIGLNDSIPGYDLDIVSGAEYAIDLRLPPGNRIRGLSVRGKPVQADDQFTLALNSSRQGGGGGFAMLAGAPVVYDHGENIRTLLIRELRARALLRADDFGSSNWRILPDEAARAVRRRFAPTTEPVAGSPPRDTTLIRILAISDLRGSLLPEAGGSPGRPTGGIIGIKRLMDSLGAACRCADFRISGGDVMQGSLPSNLEFGRSVIAAMNLLGIDVSVIGDRDLDWGVDTLLKRMSEARYPWLVANVVDSASGRRPDWAVAYKVVTMGGLRVGVIGYLGPETNEGGEGNQLEGLRIEGPASVSNVILRLRQEHPDLVIVLAHAGLECDGEGSTSTCAGPAVDLARGLDSGSVDLIIAGHRAQSVRTVIKGIPIIQAGGNGSSIAMIDVVQTLVGSRELRPSLMSVPADSVGADTAMRSFVRRFRTRTDSLVGRIIATLKVPAPRLPNQSALGNLVADAARNAVRADFALVSHDDLKADLPAGQISYAQVFSVLPLQRELVRAPMNGREVRTLVEEIL
ncbi:MAG: 5'-nucleotidase C-terminal domain-containing protein, partial [Gemmatimonadota bacterium]